MHAGWMLRDMGCLGHSLGLERSHMFFLPYLPSAGLTRAWIQGCTELLLHPCPANPPWLFPPAAPTGPEQAAQSTALGPGRSRRGQAGSCAGLGGAVVFPGPCHGRTSCFPPQAPRPALSCLMQVCFWGGGRLLAAQPGCLLRQGWPQPDSWESLGLSGS